MTSSGDESRSGWKLVLVVLGAIAGVVGAAIAWGRATPEPELESEGRDASTTEPPAQGTVNVMAMDALPPGWVQRQPPVWVKPTVVWTVGVIVAVVVALALVGILRELVLWLFLALFFSFALEPAVNYLHKRRGWRRGGATGLLLGVTFVFLMVTLLIFVSALIQGTLAIVKELPQWATDVSGWLSDTFGIQISTSSISKSANQAATSLSSSSVDPIEVLLGFSVSLIGGIFALFTVGMFIFYMVAEGPKFKRAVLSFFPPQRQEELVSIWEAAIDKTGGYFYSKLLLTVINGGLFYVVLLAIGLPGAAALALFQGVVAEFIPIVGTYIAAVVPLTIAFLSVGMPETLILLVYVLIYQQVENYLLAPRLQARTMQLHPAVAFGAALAGGAIGGLLWALLALPFAATVQASASLWLERHEVVENEFIQEQVAVVVKETKGPSLRKRVGGWVRSSRGWLRRRNPPVPVTDTPATTDVLAGASDDGGQGAVT
jgi:predicted PurR-regulated permease PerM